MSIASMLEAGESADALALTSLLEGTDSSPGSNQLGAAIKIVFDRSLQSTFEQSLSKHVRIQNSHIKTICNQHYEEFIESVDNLVTVKSEIHRLKDEIIQLNEAVQDSGGGLLVAAEELVDLRRMKSNITQARRVLNRCNSVMILIGRAMSQIADNSFFHALKTVDQLQRNCLRELQSGGASTSALVISIDCEIVPYLIHTIKEKVRCEFDVWLSKANSKSEQIGAWAMTNTEKVIKAEAVKESKRRHQRMKALTNIGIDGNQDIDVSSLSSAVSDAVDMENRVTDDDLFERIAFDFAPAYQALHIYESLNIPTVFAKYYVEKRSCEAMQFVEFHSGVEQGDFLKSLPPYFSQISGFFIIEESVFKSGNQLVTRAEIASVWEMAMSKMKVSLLEQLMYVTCSAQMLELKSQVIVFCHTMDLYGFSTAPLISFIASNRDKYEELLTNQFKAIIDTIFEKEKYEPLTIDTAENFRKFVIVFGLDKHLPTEKDNMSSNDTRQFPTSVPFSYTVPLLCRAVKHFIADYFAFALYLPDMFSHIRRAVDDILINTLNAKFNSTLDDAPSLNVSQAVQISVNSDFMQPACTYWEKLTHVFPDPKYYVKPFSLNARINFSDTRTRAEDAIFEAIQRKIGEMMDLMACNMEWAPQLPQAGPCDTIMMLVSFLQTTMACTQYMPASVRTAVHFASCRSISRILVQFVSDIPRFNLLGIYNLGQDVTYLEEYSKQTEIPNLFEAFAELRQLTTMMMLSNIEEIGDPVIREALFPLLSVPKLIVFLDKYKDLGYLSVVPPEIPRITRKQIDNTLRKLRHG